jgi:hypothetical protein
MSRDDLHVDTERVWQALDHIDLMSALTGVLSGQASAAGMVRLVPGSKGDLVLFEVAGTDRRCVLPAAQLRAISVGIRSAFAVRQLLGAAVVTAAVLSSGPAGQLVLGVIARHIPGISHVTLYDDDPAGAVLEPRVLDLLDLAGIGFARAESVGAATRGANVVIAVGATTPGLLIDQLSPRCVLINAIGEDLPDPVVDHVGRIYVDDLRLVELNRHRYFVRVPRPEGELVRPRRLRLAGCERERAAQLSDFHQLAQKSTNAVRLDEIVLVELLENRSVDAAIAGRLQLMTGRRGGALAVSELYAGFELSGSEGVLCPWDTGSGRRA